MFGPNPLGPMGPIFWSPGKNLPHRGVQHLHLFLALGRRARGRILGTVED